MDPNEKQYTIFIRSTGDRVPATKEEFDLYYRDIDRYRRRQQRHGRCVCPRSRELTCDMDCLTCSYSRAGDLRSLDYADTTDEGSERPWVETIPDQSPLMEDIMADASEMELLFRRLTELLPEAAEIGRQRMAGETVKQIASLLGVSRQVLEYRLKKAKEILIREFPDFFEKF